jgi:hypothetical protein
MVQPGTLKPSQGMTGIPLSTTALPVRQSPTNAQVNRPAKGVTQDSTSERQSFVNDLNSPGVYSAASTPILSYFSPRCYINSPSNIGTPLMYCTSPSYYSPTQICHSLPSIGMSLDVPPALELYNQNPSNVAYPSHVSCNIRAPAQSVLKNHPWGSEAELSMPLTTQVLTNSALSLQSKTNHKPGKECTEVKECKEDADIWDDGIEYTECKQNQGSNLYITWSGMKSDLLARLRREDLKVRVCLTTPKEGLFNVVFEDHLNARKAFTSQVQIRLRMIPPRNSTRNWFKSPSPKFLVKYETKFRLTLRSGRAPSHDIVGEFLMSNFEVKSGCYI